MRIANQAADETKRWTPIMDFDRADQLTHTRARAYKMYARQWIRYAELAWNKRKDAERMMDHNHVPAMLARHWDNDVICCNVARQNSFFQMLS